MLTLWLPPSHGYHLSGFHCPVLNSWLPPSHGDSMGTTLPWFFMCVVTIIYCLDFGLNLTGNDTFCGNFGGYHLWFPPQHGNDVWLPPLWFPPSCGDSMVTTRYCLNFGLNLTGNYTFCGNHGNHVVSTFGIMLCPPGNHMVST